jgi:putative acetyltransferase
MNKGIREGHRRRPGSVVISPAPMYSPDAATLTALLDAELAARYPGLNYDHFELTASQVRAGHGVFLIAREGDEPIGCAALRRLDRFTGEIKRVYVLPSARGARVGRRLLAELEWYARQFGLSTLVLHTGVRQPEAIRLYENSGFTPCSGFWRYAHTHEGVCMAKVTAR